MDSLTGYILKYFTPTCLILAFAQNTSSLSKDLESNTLEVEIYGQIFLVIMALIIILMIIVPMETEESKISPDPNVEAKSDLTI